MKLDTHVHTSPVSLCGRLSPEEMISMYSKQRIEAVMLTNHLYPRHFEPLGNTVKERCEVYTDSFYRAYDAGRACGITVLFGIEVRLVHAEHQPEFVLYGVEPEKMMSYVRLPLMSQKDLFDWCNTEDILMYQAHPFRAEHHHVPADPKWMHGVEVYNPHMFDPRLAESLAFAREYGLRMTAGSDFHEPEYFCKAGIVTDDGITDSLELRDWMKENPQPQIFGENGMIET